MVKFALACLVAACLLIPVEAFAFGGGGFGFRARGFRQPVARRQVFVQRQVFVPARTHYVPAFQAPVYAAPVFQAPVCY